jgi:hypothetical protein
MRLPTSQKTRIIAVAVVAFLVAGVAFAYFTSVGSGAGSASVANAQAVTFSAGTASGQLYPGGAGDAVLAVANPNPFPVRVDSIVLNTGHAVNTSDPGFSASGGTGTCAEPALSFTTQTNGGNGWTIPASAAAYPITLVNAVAMGVGADDGCQGATFTVYLQAGS